MTMGRRDLDYDEVLRYIGQFGTFQVFLAHQDSARRYQRTKCCQKQIFFWLWLVSAGGGLAVMVFAFTGMSIIHTFSPHSDIVYVLCAGLEPRYRCRVPECELSNSSIYTQPDREGLLPSWYILMIEKA